MSRLPMGDTLANLQRRGYAEGAKGQNAEYLKQKEKAKPTSSEFP